MNYQRILAITINPGLAIVGTLPSGTVSEAYSATLQGYGGVEPYTWSIVSGSLPSGFSASIDSNGDYVISGTTTDIGDHALVIMLEDSAGRSVARRFNLRVIALPLVISGHAPDGEVGTAYTFTYTVSGGLAPYSFFVASGSLPSGLSLNASTGTISGTPTAVQSTAFTIQVRDSQSPYASANQYDTVNVQADLLQVSGTFATPVDNGDPLTGSLTITGGVSPYSVSVYSGTAPPGVTFSVSGSSVIASGNTTTNGSYSWTLRVTSTDGQHADSAQSVTVAAGGDPYWANVVALLHFDGTDGSTAITDEKGKTWTASGNAQIDTAEKKFGTGSVLLDGNLDYVSSADHDDFDFGSGDFTIECFISINAATGNYQTIAAKDSNTLGRSFQFRIYSPLSAISFVYYNTGTIVNGGFSFATDTWYHVAVCRSANKTYLSVEGTILNPGGTASNVTMNNSTAAFSIGQDLYSGFPLNFNGHIDEFRVTKGVGRYTSDFTPPSAPFPNS